MIKRYTGKIKLETDHLLLERTGRTDGPYIQSPVPRTIEKAFTLFEDQKFLGPDNSCGLKLSASDHNLHVDACSEGNFKVIDNENYLMFKTDKYELEIYLRPDNRLIEATLQLSKLYFDVDGYPIMRINNGYPIMRININWWRDDLPIAISMTGITKDCAEKVEKLWDTDHAAISNFRPNGSVKLRGPKEVA